MKRLTLILSFAVLGTLPVRAADVSGDWKVNGSIGEFPVDLVCTFKEADKKLTGLCKGADIGELALKGESDGTNVTWSYDVNFGGQQMNVVYTAKVESDKEMKGSIAVMGNQAGSFAAKKQDK